MPLILSLAQLNVPAGSETLAACPEGLFRVEADQFVPVAQPQVNLYCCAASGGRLFVGGLPHGIAYSDDAGASWTACWLDGVEAPAVCIAPDPRGNGGLLAGTEGGGILHSSDTGASWTVGNLGLRSFNVLALAWAPPTPDNFPAWETVFAATDEGVYRSPNGGLGWRRCAGVQGVVQAIAVSPNWANDGVVIAGTEASGLFYSADKGHHFAPVDQAPQQIDALATTATGWLLTNDAGLWASADGWQWALIDASIPALVLLAAADVVLAGGEFGLKRVDLAELHLPNRHPLA